MTKVTGSINKTTASKEEEPLRFKDLNVGDVFRHRADGNEPLPKYLLVKISNDRYRYLTTETAMGTEMEMEMGTAIETGTAMVEVYDEIHFALSPPRTTKTKTKRED